MVEARLGWLSVDDPTDADFFFDPLDGSVGEVRARRRPSAGRSR